MDENLINKVINGNEEQFRKLFDELSPDLFRIAKVRLRENEDINDAIQNTMIITYQSIIKKKKINNLKAWIIKVLINECNKIYNLNQKNVSIYDRLYESIPNHPSNLEKATNTLAPKPETDSSQNIFVNNRVRE